MERLRPLLAIRSILVPHSCQPYQALSPYRGVASYASSSTVTLLTLGSRQVRAECVITKGTVGVWGGVCVGDVTTPPAHQLGFAPPPADEAPPLADDQVSTRSAFLSFLSSSMLQQLLPAPYLHLRTAEAEKIVTSQRALLGRGNRGGHVIDWGPLLPGLEYEVVLISSVIKV